MMANKKQRSATIDIRDAAAGGCPKPATPGCARGHCHYWVIETPRGPISKGVCKFCGLTRDFDSFGPDFWWHGNMPEILTPGAAGISNKDKSS